jgi:hypothetical protein
MSKRAFASLLAIAVCFAPLSQASAVTAKAGGSCSKLKTTSIVKGKKFTCIKSGKKLVWDKGVLVKALVTKPKPTSTPAISNSIPVCPKLDSADQSGISQKRADALVGMSESQAEECANSLKWEFRVGQRDSEMFATTRDYRLDRVTVVVMLGVITRVDVG